MPWATRKKIARYNSRKMRALLLLRELRKLSLVRMSSLFIMFVYYRLKFGNVKGECRDTVLCRDFCDILYGVCSSVSPRAAADIVFLGCYGSVIEF